jgi:hypothetical protein
MVVSVLLMGGLGNQLFQIFATIAYSIRYKTPCIFEYSDLLTIGVHRPTYWNNFLTRLKLFTRENVVMNLPLYRENGFHYTKLLSPSELSVANNINELNGIKFYGYFQSYKYFEDQYENIIKLINLKELQNNIREKYTEYLDSRNTTIISLHFRLGDYKNNPNIHPIMTTEYYIKALKNMLNIIQYKENVEILYFCESDDNEIVSNNIMKIKENIDEADIKFIKVDDKIPDWEQMLIMSCCDHNIIANSSFSWWGAYFNNNLNKIVCFPSLWFGPICNHDTKDLCPANWIKINTTIG